MGKILAIDYGNKRTGLAVTDDLQLIASALETVLTADLWPYLNAYFEKNQVDIAVIGEPKDLMGNPTDASKKVAEFVVAFSRKYPTIEIARMDERFTSKLAVQTMVQGGMKKKDRRKKGNVDRIAATLMLQDYLNYR